MVSNWRWGSITRRQTELGIMMMEVSECSDDLGTHSYYPQLQ